MNRALSRLRTSADSGFTLIEVMVALIIFALVITSTTALLTSSLRGLALGRADTVGKNLTQEGMEKLRNLPFFVSATIAGGSPDLFDQYYWKTSNSAATVNTTGFVPAGGARSVVDGDPAAGAFYRTVVPQVSTEPRYADYSQRIAVQLLQEDGSLLANPVFDSTSIDVAGKQPATLVATTVTTAWRAGGKVRRFSLLTRIADGDVRAPVVTLQARLSALRVSGLLPSNRELLVEAGVLNLDGSLSSSTVSSASATGAQGTVANGPSFTGATAGYNAPPTGSVATVNASSGSLSDGSVVTQIANTRTENVAASTDGGQPTTATSAAPVTATMFGNGNGSLAMTADNRPDTTSTLKLSSSPMIRLDAPSCGGSCPAVQGTGYLASVGGGAHTATASTTASLAGTLKLLPTTFAPEGLLQLSVGPATLTCTSQATASPVSRVTASFTASLTYFRVDPVSGVAAYSSPVALSLSASTPAGAADPLSTIPLATTKVRTADAFGPDLFLRDYIQDWSSLTPSGVAGATQLGNGGKSVSVNVPGFFTLSSKPLRAETESALGFQFGAGTCTAGDVR